MSALTSALAGNYANVFARFAPLPALPGKQWSKGYGQVAQVVERSPEKAGVGGSTPSLATILFNGLADQLEISHL